MESGKNRSSSILKPQKARNPLSDLDFTQAAEDISMVTIGRPLMRRVSFASSNFVKEFATDPEKNTIWDSTYEEIVNSDSTQSSENAHNTLRMQRTLFSDSAQITNENLHCVTMSNNVTGAFYSDKENQMYNNCHAMSPKFSGVKLSNLPTEVDRSLNKENINILSNDIRFISSKRDFQIANDNMKVMSSVSLATESSFRNSKNMTVTDDTSMEFTLHISRSNKGSYKVCGNRTVMADISMEVTRPLASQLATNTEVIENKTITSEDDMEFTQHITDINTEDLENVQNTLAETDDNMEFTQHIPSLNKTIRNETIMSEQNMEYTRAVGVINKADCTQNQTVTSDQLEVNENETSLKISSGEDGQITNSTSVEQALTGLRYLNKTIRNETIMSEQNMEYTRAVGVINKADCTQNQTVTSDDEVEVNENETSLKISSGEDGQITNSTSVEQALTGLRYLNKTIRDETIMSEQNMEYTRAVGVINKADCTQNQTVTSDDEVEVNENETSLKISSGEDGQITNSTSVEQALTGLRYLNKTIRNETIMSEQNMEYTRAVGVINKADCTQNQLVTSDDEVEVNENETSLKISSGEDGQITNSTSVEQALTGLRYLNKTIRNETIMSEQNMEYTRAVGVINKADCTQNQTVTSDDEVEVNENETSLKISSGEDGQITNSTSVEQALTGLRYLNKTIRDETIMSEQNMEYTRAVGVINKADCTQNQTVTSDDEVEVNENETSLKISSGEDGQITNSTSVEQALTGLRYLNKTIRDETIMSEQNMEYTRAVGVINKADCTQNQTVTSDDEVEVNENETSLKISSGEDGQITNSTSVEQALTGLRYLNKTIRDETIMSEQNMEYTRAVGVINKADCTQNQTVTSDDEVEVNENETSLKISSGEDGQITNSTSVEQALTGLRYLNKTIRDETIMSEQNMEYTRAVGVINKADCTQNQTVTSDDEVEVNENETSLKISSGEDGQITNSTSVEQALTGLRYLDAHIVSTRANTVPQSICEFKTPGSSFHTSFIDDTQHLINYSLSNRQPKSDFSKIITGDFNPTLLSSKCMHLSDFGSCTFPTSLDNTRNNQTHLDYTQIDKDKSCKDYYDDKPLQISCIVDSKTVALHGDTLSVLQETSRNNQTDLNDVEVTDDNRHHQVTYLLNDKDNSSVKVNEIVKDNSSVKVNEIVKDNSSVKVEEIVKDNSSVKVEEIVKDNSSVKVEEIVKDNSSVKVEEIVKDNSSVKVEEIVKDNSSVKVEEIVKDNSSVKVEEIVKDNSSVKVEEIVKDNSSVKVEEIVKDNSSVKVEEIVKDNSSVKVEEKDNSSVKVEEIVKDNSSVKVEEIVKDNRSVKVEEIFKDNSSVKVEEIVKTKKRRSSENIEAAVECKKMALDTIENLNLVSEALEMETSFNDQIKMDQNSQYSRGETLNISQENLTLTDSIDDSVLPISVATQQVIGNIARSFNSTSIDCTDFPSKITENSFSSRSTVLWETYLANNNSIRSTIEEFLVKTSNQLATMSKTAALFEEKCDEAMMKVRAPFKQLSFVEEAQGSIGSSIDYSSNEPTMSDMIQEENPLVEVDMKIERVLTLEEEIEKKCIRSKRYWTIFAKEENKYQFYTLYNSIRLVVYFNMEVGTVNATEVYSRISDESDAVALFVHKICKERLSEEHIKSAVGDRFDILTLLDYVYMNAQKMLDILNEFYNYKKSYAMKMDENFRMTLTIVNTSLANTWCILVDMGDIDNVTENSVSAWAKVGTVQEAEIKNLVKRCPRGVAFLRSFLKNIHEYANLLKKRKDFLKMKMENVG